MTRALHWIMVVWLVATVPCNAVEPVSTSAQSLPPDSKVELLEVPEPELAKVDLTVREQIRTSQKALADSMTRPNTSREQKSNAFGSMGQIYQAYGFNDAALACYMNAASLEPQSFRWFYYAGYLHQASGDSESALRDYRRALALNPNDSVIMLRLGNLTLSMNQVNLAKEWFVKAMAHQNPPTAAALTGLGKIAMIEHQYDSAVRYFTEALHREPSASSIHYQLAMTYRALGDLRHMQDNLDARGEADPTIQDPLLDEIKLLKQGKVNLLERGITAMHEDRFADAVASYRQMVSLDPSDAIAHTYLGVALAKSGKRDQALEQYTLALQLNPIDAPVHYDEGILFIENGKEELAITHFREAIRLDPGFVAAHFQLANLLMRRGKDDLAGQEYGVVVALEPQNGFAHLMQAMAAVHGGEFARALALLDEASQAFPHDPDIANALARLLAAAPDPNVRNGNRALHIIEKIGQSQENFDFEEGITLGMALAAVGRFKEAAALQRAMISELEESRKFDLAKRLRQYLFLYEHDKPSPTPWPSDDPVFAPVPGKSQLPAEMGPMSAH